MLRDQDMSRRGMLAGLGAVAAAAMLPAWAASPAMAQGGVLGRAPRKRALRLAHLTDIHIQPELAANEGFSACLKHLASQSDKPELILTGGDTIMDGFEADEARTKLQWDLWSKAIKNEAPAPVASALGNHDIWAWNKGKSKTKGTEPAWGKKWACEVFAQDRPYRSFDKNGWHIVILDSTHVDAKDANGYIARLDDAQFDWLSSDLAAVNAATPVLVLSHIPIVSVIPIVNSKRDDKAPSNFTVGNSLIHDDAVRIKNLFAKHRNVKLCLSGHLHLLDRVEYNGVTYICGGAVCGQWWKGDHAECAAGYGLVDLFDDGTFDHSYVTYGWKPRA
jgi:Icc protein